MEKERAGVPIVVVNNDVKTSALFNEYEGDIVVNGLLIVDNDKKICCRKLYVQGLDTYSKCKLTIEGGLVSSSNICAYDLEVKGAICCFGDCDSNYLTVTGDTYVSGSMKVSKLRNGGEIIAANANIG